MYQYTLRVLFSVLSILYSIFSLNPTIVYAQTATSCTITKVGSPAGPQPPLPPECSSNPTNTGSTGSSSSPSSNSLINTFSAIKYAYDNCTGGITVQGNTTNTNCIDQKLKDKGLSPKQISVFNQRRSHSYPSSGGCTQCLGFVGIVFATTSEDPSALTGYVAAKNVLNYSSFSGGSYTFVKQPKGTMPQPGDIGVSGKSTFGHILIVGGIVAGKPFFIGYEANWHHCQVSSDANHPDSDYTFYRMTSTTKNKAV